MTTSNKSTTEKILRDIDPEVSDIKTVTDNLPDSGSLTSIAQASALATVDTVVDGIQTDLTAIKAITDTLDGASFDTVESNIIAIKAVADLLPDAGALTSIAQDSTVAKEATLGGLVTTVGVAGAGLSAIPDMALDSTVAKEATVAKAADVLSELSGGVDAVNRAMGKVQVKEISITSAANAGDVTLATITSQPCLIKSIVVSSNGVTTADLTNIQILGGASKVITFIDSVSGARANLDATDKQVAWGGEYPVRVAATKTIVATLTGTGATAVSLVATIEYESCSNGGYLA